MTIKTTAKKLVLTSAILACFTSTVSQANDSEEDDWVSAPATKEEMAYAEGNWSMGGGALVGATTGGPVGLIVGAFAGKLIGNHKGMENELKENVAEVERLRIALQQQKNVVAELRTENIENKLQVASLGKTTSLGLVNFEQVIEDGFSFTVNFKTNSDRIEAHQAEQCRSMAASLRKFPNLKINLHGFADERGSESYNMNLSSRRVEAVKNLLLQQGVPSASINIKALGEKDSLGLGRDTDSFSFDRRVVISFNKQGV